MPKTIYDKIAQAIMEFEGYFEGSVSFRNNNPGNLKYLHQTGSIGVDSQGHAIFETFQDGWNALTRQVMLMFTGRSTIYQPSMTLYEVFKKYAEGNSVEYAQFVATRLGVTPETKLQELV